MRNKRSVNVTILNVTVRYNYTVQLEEPPPPGQVQPGPRAFINLQNKFGDEVRSFIQSTQELIG